MKGAEALDDAESPFPMTRWLYQLAVAAALVVAGPFLVARRGRHYLTSLPGRFGRHGEGDRDHGRGGLWVHAVSVGEVGVAATLIKTLPASLPLVVTTVTPTGQARARSLFGQRGAVTYLPVDLAPTISRFLRRFEPRALVLTEGDYWPLLLSRAKRLGLPVAVVNGRVSDRTFPRLQRLARFLPALVRAYFQPVDRFGMQTNADRDRLLALGVPAEKIVVTGNLKYDTPEPAALPALESQLASLAAGRPVLVAGSTMAGEEQIVLEAFATASAQHPALLVLAPRHPERSDEVERMLAASGHAFLRRGRLQAVPGLGDERVDVLLLDTVGELAALYRGARGAFIGGTLAPTGGHNPLEAARFGVPVAVGPSMDNFRDMAERFDADGAWRRVANVAELTAALGEWLADAEGAAALGAKGAALVAANRGALARTQALLAPLLARAAGTAST